MTIDMGKVAVINTESGHSEPSSNSDRVWSVHFLMNALEKGIYPLLPTTNYDLNKTDSSGHGWQAVSEDISGFKAMEKATGNHSLSFPGSSSNSQIIKERI